MLGQGSRFDLLLTQHRKAPVTADSTMALSVSETNFPASSKSIVYQMQCLRAGANLAPDWRQDELKKRQKKNRIDVISSSLPFLHLSRDLRTPPLQLQIRHMHTVWKVLL